MSEGLLFFKMPCQWCGTVNHDSVPTPAKDDAISMNCIQCRKTICEFHWFIEKKT